MIVERVIRTYWTILKKVLMANETLNWLKFHDDIISNYNNRVHRSIRDTPHNVFSGKQKKQQLKRTFISKQKAFKIGDSLRILLKGKTFTKSSFEPKWSVQVYKVVGEERGKFVLENNKGNKLRKHFLPRELQLSKSVGETGLVFTEKQFKQQVANLTKRLNVRSGLDVGEEGTFTLPEHRASKPRRSKRQPKPREILDL